ncbi:hypothetical protein [Bradyrhizobium sp. SYSU BS000235]|uniref:hypothetical protein n=1 Tax=Bradyrhizobium sp. SYSU BS000235 TaxID=3411332 RepID=UPI003C727943
MRAKPRGNFARNRVQVFSGYLSATLTAIVHGHRQSQIDVLMPWIYSRRTNG